MMEGVITLATVAALGAALVAMRGRKVSPSAAAPLVNPAPLAFGFLQRPDLFNETGDFAVSKGATSWGSFSAFRDNASEREVVARTMYGEARDQGHAGMALVAVVIRNRARAGRKFGGPSARSVALAPFQFSVWNADSRNRRAALAADVTDAEFSMCLALYDQVFQFDDLSVVPAHLVDATHYFVSNTARPFWASKIDYLGHHGAHEFYLEV